MSTPFNTEPVSLQGAEFKWFIRKIKVTQENHVELFGGVGHSFWFDGYGLGASIFSSGIVEVVGADASTIN